MRKRSVVTSILAALVLFFVVTATFYYQGDRVITFATVVDNPDLLELESQTVEKEVDQYVHIKARIKNTGEDETSYLIIVKFSEDDFEAWEKVGLIDVKLSTGTESDILLLGKVKCSEAMIGKYFDVKVIVYRHETETVLDAKEIDKAWYVKETTASGAVTDLWID